ncbi:MAG: diacylglycerol kinase [Chloroflexota bacterium]|jgi:YegS/Rv2252/BmrU family lipid kinase|nr:MAG: diacylglycerol kinase [Chloroflexota bacterium]
MGICYTCILRDKVLLLPAISLALLLMTEGKHIMSTELQATLIYNPHAGFDDWQQNINATAAFWRARGWDITLRQTDHPRHATALAVEAVRAGHQLVLAAGGDGTLHEVANGLLGSQTVLAVLPAGTTNCFARDLGLPAPNGANPYWLLEASERLMAGSVHAVDVGECSNGGSFILWAAVGVDSRIVEGVEPRSRLLKRFGMAGYIAKATLPFLLHQGEKMRVSVDDEVVEEEMLAVVVSNSRLYAGGLFNLSPESVLDDGRFDVWMLCGRYSPQMLAHSLFIMAGRHGARENILKRSGSRVLIETSTAQPFHLDGELNRFTPIEIALEPGFLRILAPQGAPADLFVNGGCSLTTSVTISRPAPAATGSA